MVHSLLLIPGGSALAAREHKPAEGREASVV